MAKGKHREEHIVILLERHPDVVDGEVEDGEGEPTDEEDGDHADEQPASPRTSDNTAHNMDNSTTSSSAVYQPSSSHSSPDW